MSRQTNPFADLEDPAWSTGGPLAPSKPKPENPAKRLFEDGVIENCPKCRGTGTFVSYAGRPLGPCFKCKGKGKLRFKNNAATRRENREKAKARERRKQDEAVERFAASEPEVHAWLVAASDRGFGFAQSLLDGLRKYGSLTERQLAKAAEMAAQDAQRAQERQAARKAETSDIDLSDLHKGFYAVPGGDTRLKVNVRKPGKNSKWHGHIFVDDGAVYGQRQNYGRQAPGELYSGKIQDQLRAILADPKAARAAYGQLTGVCGRCSRPLEDPESIARGVGPVCAEKEGF